MPDITFVDSRTGNDSRAKGSDGRSDVSSRSDTRGYYNSRDEKESFSLVFDDDNATINDFVAYLKNDKTDKKEMVIRSASVNGEVDSKFSFLTVTGTAGGGTPATPATLNKPGVSPAATVTALTTADSSVTPMSGLTADVEIGHVGVKAGGHEEFRFQDQLRLGPGQACAIRMDKGTADSYVFGDIFFFFESPKG